MDAVGRTLSLLLIAAVVGTCGYFMGYVDARQHVAKSTCTDLQYTTYYVDENNVIWCD